MTQKELKAIIAEVVSSEFKKYVPFLIKEIRKVHGSVLTESVRPKPTIKEKLNYEVDISEGDLKNTDYLRQMVNLELMQKQIQAEHKLLDSDDSILDQVDDLPPAIHEAVTKDYSALMAKMSARPVK